MIFIITKNIRYEHKPKAQTIKLKNQSPQTGNIKHKVHAHRKPSQNHSGRKHVNKHVYIAKGRRRHASNTKTSPPCFHRSEFYTGALPRRRHNRHRKPTGTRITINEPSTNHQFQITPSSLCSKHWRASIAYRDLIQHLLPQTQNEGVSPKSETLTNRELQIV